MNNAVAGGSVEFKLGASYERFNFSVGTKALWWKPDWLVGTDVYSISFVQIPLYATAKLNLLELEYSNFYISGEGAYNMNFGAKIYDGYGNKFADKNLVFDFSQVRAQFAKGALREFEPAGERTVITPAK